MLALNGFAQLNGAGDFVIRVKVDDSEEKRVSFKAVPAPRL